MEEKNGEEENEIRKRMGKRKNKGERKELGLRWHGKRKKNGVILSFHFYFFKREIDVKKKMMDVFKTSQILGIINFIHQIS